MARRLQLALTSLALAVTSLVVVLLSTTPVAAQQVTQSYTTNTPLQLGLIVSLVGHKKTAVVPATAANQGKIFGVVVSPGATPVTLTQATSSQQAFVATGGIYNVLVDTQDGPIKSGDYITISSVNGIGRKATTHDNVILGKAVSAFQGTGDSIGTATLKNSQNQKVTLQIGNVLVAIGVSKNPIEQPPTNPYVPLFLTRVGQAISGKPVSVVHIYLSLLVLLATVIIVGGTLYSGVRSSFIAIGRNPLSKKSINKSLLQIVFISVGVLIIGLFGVYLLLKL